MKTLADILAGVPPLPWKRRDSEVHDADGDYLFEDDLLLDQALHDAASPIEYAILAANAFPKLVAALQKIAKPALGGKEQQWTAQQVLKEILK